MKLKILKFVIIGDGPDKEKFKKLIKKNNLEDFFIMIPWVDFVPYRSLDLVLISSNYEGVPLVMLEAMRDKIPILANNIDGMKDVLPSEWLFEKNDTKEFFRKLKNILYTDNSSLINKNTIFIKNNCSIEVFNEKFLKALA